ncbi:hypothetical protein DFH07DRAFT_827647 [Mycena maculata]|uniref:Fungal-type protein kinase domain-containing protein n=1 Tax=Mycena maculata TaxID=230809 RepID=A0AAD7ITX1_9AGAR|nr:hypothetical protein DFH07DRAFT_827647 [Mycena maculata]
MTRMSATESENSPYPGGEPPVGGVGRPSCPPATPPRNQPAVLAEATPHRASSHDSERAYRIVDQVRSAVIVELEHAWVQERENLPFQAYLKGIVEKECPGLDGRAETWLRTYDGYDSERNCWKDIPVATKKEDVLYDPLVQIMGDILKHFGNEELEKDGHVIKQRRVRKTHRLLMPHNPDDASKDPLKSEPDISLFGTGPSATEETTISVRPSYSQMASLWEVKVPPTFGEKERGQVGAYAREVFIQQPNRRFVYVTFMTATEIRILRFDRAGCYYSRRIDYHKEAVFFVKLVVLLSSFNEELLGFDTSIYWEHGHRFMRMKPAEVFDHETKAWKANTEELLFTVDDKPVFSRRTIRSRGTVCWSAKHKGKTYIVKDYWRAQGRAKESLFLRELAGVKGVGQMFTYQDDRESVRAGRGFVDAADMVSDDGEKPVLDRWSTRVVLPKYGDTLDKAGSARQLLCAIRDILEGHIESVLDKQILHRDISLGNLLLSPFDFEEAVLIDWDLAKRMRELIAGQATEGDSRTGTRAFQSVKVLYGSPDLLKHHDHMDDLESIYYVLYTILHGYDLHGNALQFSGNLALWHDPTQNAKSLSNNKRAFLRDFIPEPLTRFNGAEVQILKTLVRDLAEFFKPRLDNVVASLAARESFPAYSYDAAKGDYETFAGIITAAIQKLLEVPTESVVPLVPSPTASLKRRRQDDAESSRAGSIRPLRARTGLNSTRVHGTDSDSDEEQFSPPGSPSPAPQRRKSKVDMDLEEYVPGRGNY